MAKVEVRPLERERWHGKKGKENFTRPLTIEALVSIKTGLFATGLTDEDRERLEKITGYNLSPEYKHDKSHEFWSTPAGQVKLDYKTNVFDMDKPIDEIKVKLMKASDLVANSQKEYEEGKFPQALFVIYDEHEELEIKASKAAIKREVVIEGAKLSKARKAEIVQVLLGTSVRSQSDDFISLKLDQAVEEKGAELVLRMIKRDKKDTSLHALILEAIYKGVLRKDGTSIYYMDDQIGFDMESSIAYFKDKNNQTLKAQIMEKLQ
jgi:hypothetical protein